MVFDGADGAGEGLPGGGVEYQGRHEPLVSIDPFASVQALLTSRNQSTERKRAHPHYLKGTLYCARCGARLSFTRAKGNGGKYDYFYCLGRHAKRTNCDLPYVPSDVIEQMIIDRYDTLQVNEITATRIGEHMIAAMRERGAEAEKLAQRERRRIQRLESERRKLLQAHLAGAVPIELLKEEQARIASELANAGGALAATEINWQQIVKNLNQALGLATRFASAYAEATPQLRRRINQAVFEQIHVDAGSTAVTLTPAFAHLLADDLLTELETDTTNPGTDVRYRGSNKGQMVELRGIEPLTSSMPWKRSTN